MTMMNIPKLIAIAFALAVMAGCSSTGTDTSGSDMSGEGGYSNGETSGMSAEELERQRLLNEQNARNQESGTLREVRVFYFEFDSSSLKPEAHMPLQAHATFLASNPSARIVLNGYGDERGTKEYNLALGERRAKAVERFLVVNGASANQIETVSYGEEFPADPGHDDNAWSQNRRVELQYK